MLTVDNLSDYIIADDDTWDMYDIIILGVELQLWVDYESVDRSTVSTATVCTSATEFVFSGANCLERCLQFLNEATSASCLLQKVGG